MKQGLFIIKDYDNDTVLEYVLIDADRLQEAYTLLEKCDAKSDEDEGYDEEYHGFFTELEDHGIEYTVIYQTVTYEY